MWRIAVFFVWLILVLPGISAWAELFPEAGPAGTTVTIGGGKFGEFVSTAINRVDFNGVPALIQVWEPDLIMVKVPLAAKTGLVTVVNGANEKLKIGTFQVEQVRITRLEPAEAEPGSVLIIEGKNFGNTAGSRDPNTMFGVNQVLINGIRAQVRRWRPNKIEVKIPANATSGEVVVRLASSDPLPDGSCCAPVDYVESNPVALTLIPPIGFEPKKGPIGSKVVLSGQNFGTRDMAHDVIAFNGQPAVIAQWTDRTIVVHVPLNATSGPLTLKQTKGSREVGTFEVVESHVTEFFPKEGPIGTLVKIKGENFGVYSEGGKTAYAFDFNAGENAVEFSGVPAIIHRWQDNEINVWVPFSGKSGSIVVKRGGNIPNPDGSCCAQKGVVSVEAGTFTIQVPQVFSYSPKSAGLDEIVTIRGTGFGDFLKIAEHTRLELNQEAHDWQNYRLGPNVSRSEVLINGIAAHVVSWKEDEIQVKVPRRNVFGIGNPEGFNPDLSKGELVVRRGSWDLTKEGKCCTPKRWVDAVAGEFTILRRGLPDSDFYSDYVTERD